MPSIKEHYKLILERDSSMVEYLNRISEKYFKKGLKPKGLAEMLGSMFN